MDRRTMMKATIAAAAAPGIAAAAATGATPVAAAPAPTGQVTGAYKMKLGDFTVAAVTDGIFRLPLKEGFITNAKLDEVQKAMEEVFLPKDTLPIPFTPLLVDTGSKKILIDTGYGEMGPPSAGQLTANLAAAGIDPKAIDMVIISHFHGDHIQGLRSKAGELMFPNAEIAVPAAEWDYWMDDAKMAAAPEGLKANFQGVRRVFGPNAKDIKRYDAGKEITTGIQAVAAYGHTPGHTTLAIQSGDARLLYLADVTNNPLLLARNPDWSPAFDQDAAAARATRHKMLDMAAQERALVAGYHYPFPAHGHIQKTAKGYDFVPAMWNPAL